jgi:hypothetical protein
VPLPQSTLWLSETFLTPLLDFERFQFLTRISPSSKCFVVTHFTKSFTA